MSSRFAPRHRHGGLRQVVPGTKLRARRRFSNTVDLALIDLVMPVMNGRELATRIRAVEPGRAILFMTGYDDLSGREDPFAQEMVINKPFKLVELAAAVERALPGRHGERPGPRLRHTVRS